MSTIFRRRTAHCRWGFWEHADWDCVGGYRMRGAPPTGYLHSRVGILPLATGMRYPSYPYKKDKDRREGKGRCCLRDRIDSIPCCASYFAPGWFKDRGEFILFFISSRYNSSYSSYRPGAINPILHIVLVKVILFFKSSWYNSSYSSYRPGAINPILHIVLEK